MPDLPPNHRPPKWRGATHEAAPDPEQRKRERFYRTRRWLDAREAKLRRDPLCQACKLEDRIVIASHVDHAKPISQGGSLTDDAQLVSLCLPCHSRKTLLERHGKPAPPVAPSTPRQWSIA